jgi:release factor glutamine methyltransferase
VREHPVVTIKDIIEKSTLYLKGREFVDSPRLEAEMLLGHILDLKRIELYLNYDRPLQEGELKKIRLALRKRATGYPMAYILGTKGFYKSDFIVTSETFIPRPETELLVEKAVKLCQAMDQEVIHVCDMGAGTGAIGLSVALEEPRAQLTLIEKSDGAAKVCEQNLKKFDLTHRAKVLKVAITEDLILPKKYDLILANPPYIAFDDQNVEPWVKLYEPEIALFASDGGLYEIKSWIRVASSHIKPGGFIIFEHGDQQGPKVEQIMHDNGFIELNPIMDLSHKWRHTFGKKK